MATKKLNTEIFYTILVVSIAVFWGMGFVFIPWAQQSNSPSSLICLFRFGVSAILIAAIFNRKIKIRKENILMSFICGILIFVGFLFNVMCQEYTTPSNAAFFTATNVVIVPILCAIFFRKYKTPVTVYVCAGVSVIGVLVICMGGEGGMQLSFGIGELMALASAILFSFHVLAMTKALEKTDSISLTFSMFAVASVLFLAYYLIVDLPKIPFSELKWAPFTENGVFSLGFGLSITGITVLCSFYAYLVQTKAQTVMNPTKVTLILSSESSFGAVFSMIFGMESFKWSTVVGGALILAAVFYTGLATRPKPVPSASPQPEAAPDDGTHKAEPPAEKAETENGRTREEQPPVELPAISEVIGAAQIPSIRQTLCETDKQENPQSDADDRES